MKSILVVGDSAVIMELRFPLTTSGCENTEARGRVESFNIAEENRFDLILPYMGFKGNEDRFLKVEYSRYVSKPIDIEKFKIMPDSCVWADIRHYGEFNRF